MLLVRGIVENSRRIKWTLFPNYMWNWNDFWPHCPFYSEFAEVRFLWIFHNLIYFFSVIFFYCCFIRTVLYELCCDISSDNKSKKKTKKREKNITSVGVVSVNVTLLPFRPYLVVCHRNRFKFCVLAFVHMHVILSGHENNWRFHSLLRVLTIFFNEIRN